MKVFLSSTAQDLVEHRKVADDTILRLSQEAVVMERFGPLPGEPVAECERKARECDVLLCIVAHRYGFVPERGRGSITRREVEAAKAAGRDVLVWIVDDDHPWTQKKEQDLLADPSVLAEPARQAEVIEGVQALHAFKSWLRSTFVCDTFGTPDDLGKKIAIALRNRDAERAVDPGRRSPKGEVRVVHALQPAPHFHGRDELVAELRAWVADLASPDRVWSLVAAGGTGKTAIVERIVREIEPGEANVLVWSFYEKPSTEAFLLECNQLFLGEDEGPAGGRLERLERGLRDGRPHLVVLDGLERVQEDFGGGRVRGELSDHTLKLLLRVLAAGLGRARALVTSRFPLVDLHDWQRRGYRETRLDDLAPEAAEAVLRGWEVEGKSEALRAVAAQVGNHALSVAVIGSYLQSFAGRRIEEAAHFDLDAVTGDDPRAAKLARVLAFYADRLPGEERELLIRLSVFPRGVTLDLVGELIDAGGEVAGLLAGAKPNLNGLLQSLKRRGLIFEYRSGRTAIWTAHPFLRERFGQLLACPTERVFDVVARALSAGLEARPTTYPTTIEALDRYEQWIEATRLAGDETRAFELYLFGLGGYSHLAEKLVEYQRGYRILSRFSPTGFPDRLAPTLDLRERSLLLHQLGLFAAQLGRLEEARTDWEVDLDWGRQLGDLTGVSLLFRNWSELARAQGLGPEAKDLAEAALTNARSAKYSPQDEAESLGFRGYAFHMMGDVTRARADFVAAEELGGTSHGVLDSDLYAQHLLDLGALERARQICDNALELAERSRQNFAIVWFRAILARVDLAEEKDPSLQLDEIRHWTSRTGDIQHLIEAHLLTARHLLKTGAFQSALDETETGLVHATTCGFGLLRIQLLVALARIRLAWPDPPAALQAAREALDLATHQECQYAWGEADAAQVWGEAYFADRQPELARRAFTRALSVRRRIEHPGVAETERWLNRIE